MHMLKSKLLSRLRKSGFIRKNEVNISLLNEISSAPPLIEFPRHRESIQTKGRLMLPSLLADNSIGLELGVAAGYFSDALLDSESISELYSLDAWGDHHDSWEYVLACNRLSRHGTRSHVMRGYFDQFIHIFPEQYFDFIYFDAYAHNGQQDGHLFQQWYPKLKKGGLCSGHDYDPEHWPQIVAAVDRFAASLGKAVNIIPGVFTNNPQDIHPSWFFYK
jgi:hypothetical protein